MTVLSFLYESVVDSFHPNQRALKSPAQTNQSSGAGLATYLCNAVGPPTVESHRPPPVPQGLPLMPSYAKLTLVTNLPWRFCARHSGSESLCDHLTPSKTLRRNERSDSI